MYHQFIELNITSAGFLHTISIAIISVINNNIKTLFDIPLQKFALHYLTFAVIELKKFLHNFHCVGSWQKLCSEIAIASGIEHKPNCR